MTKQNPDVQADTIASSADANRTSLSLIERASKDDVAAWERLVRLYSPLVYFWCKESGLPPADLNDVFQDVFHSLASNLEKFRPIKNGSFRGWLRTITRNKINDHYRKQGFEPKPVGGTEARNYLEQFPADTDWKSASISTNSRYDESKIQHSILRQALSNIRDQFAANTWQAFWMVVIDGREASDVAADLEMRPGTVRVAKSRVLKRLRLEIGNSIE
jgi:RNA polymerase sigma-70 factor (ECF subfamily)